MNAMYLVGVLGFFACLFAHFAKYQEKATGLKISFFFIFLFLALRYEYGNDYRAYLDGFIEITGYTKIFFTGERFEPGWNFLHLIFKPFGFFAMMAFLAAFNCIVYYRFIRKYVPPHYYWLAVFLYVFDPYLMLVHSSMMRQSVAISMFLVAIDFLIRKRPIGYFVCILLALSVHKSAIILLPVFLLAFMNFRLNKVFAMALLGCFVSLFVFGEKLFPYFNQFAITFFPKYAATYGGTEGAKFSTGIGLIFMVFYLISILYYAGMEFAPKVGEWEVEEETGDWPPQEEAELLPIDEAAALSQVRARRILYLFAIMTFMFVPLGLLIAIIGRINFYFTPVMIVVFPIILFSARDKFFHLVLMSALLFYVLFKFWIFFLSPIWREPFGTYQTIFSAPQIF